MSERLPASLQLEATGLSVLEAVSADNHWQVRVGFEHRDGTGLPARAQARLLVPRSVLDGASVGVVVAAGYEVPAEVARGRVGPGWAHATPVVPEVATQASAHPLCRGPNLDAALLHRVRALPWVDLRRVVLTGGSAGGYQALLLAAESYPVLAVEVDAPVLDLGHVVIRFAHHARSLSAAQAPVLATAFPLGAEVSRLLGPDPHAPTYRARSPLGLLDALTCPVSLLHSTADVLVPLDPIGLGGPDGRTTGPPPAGPTLLDLLPADLVEVRRVRPPAAAPQATAEVVLGREAAQPVTLEIPWSERRWTITVLDEGPPDVSGGGHFGHLVAPDRGALPSSHGTDARLVEQLEPGCLALLMSRLAGRSWLPGPQALDHAEAERADVLRGLAVLLDVGAETVLEEAYASLPSTLRVLGDDPARTVRSARS